MEVSDCLSLHGQHQIFALAVTAWEPTASGQMLPKIYVSSRGRGTICNPFDDDFAQLTHFGQLGLQNLKALSLRAIEDGITVDNIANEVFSKFTSLYVQSSGSSTVPC